LCRRLLRHRGTVVVAGQVGQRPVGAAVQARGDAGANRGVHGAGIVRVDGDSRDEGAREDAVRVGERPVLAGVDGFEDAGAVVAGGVVLLAGAGVDHGLVVRVEGPRADGERRLVVGQNVPSVIYAG